jgi:RHH-type proline utilization regulon transcriptional repressor/proline dehydrogenase/delta 1-pyrroline-5-carboxylate dehydrogenase
MKNSVSEFLAVTEGKRLCDSAEICTESDEELAALLLITNKTAKIDRLRYAHPDRVPQIIHQAATKLGKHISRHVPLAEGRIEMLRYLCEQSISIDYHHYGNLGERGI